jgi:hypothetical protein
VLEHELTLAGERRADPREHELALLEPIEDVVEVTAVAVQEPRHGPIPEHPADHGCGSKRTPLLRRQQVDACREHALDRVRDDDLGDVIAGAPAIAIAHDAPLVDEVPDDLLEEEGIPLAAFEYRLPGRARKRFDRQKELDEPRGVGVRERLEEERREVPLPPTPSRTPLRKLRASRTEEHEGPGNPVREIFDQVEESIVR